MSEEKIKLMMNKLGLTREEAIELIEDDEKVDKMTSAKQWDSDLSDEQKKAIKKEILGDGFRGLLHSVFNPPFDGFYEGGSNVIDPKCLR
jgi:hypothetical protein